MNVPSWLPSLLIGIVAIVVQYITGREAKAAMQASLGAKLEAMDRDIGEIKQEQVRQWQEIATHGQSIARIEGAHASKHVTQHPI